MSGVLGAFLGLQGRSRRRAFWFIQFLALALGFAAGCAVLVISGREALSLDVATLVTAGLSLAVTVRRGHDRGRSTAWSLTAFVLLWGAAVLREAGGPGDGYAAMAQLIVGLYVLVDYGINPGLPVEDRYGPPPPGSERERFE